MALARPFAAKEGWFRVSRTGGVEQLPSLPLPPGADASDMLALQLTALQLNNQLLAAMLQEMQEMVQQGIVLAVTLPIPAGSGVPIELLFDPPLFSISLTCDGPANVEYRIPNRSNAFWVQLNATEVIVFNFVKGKIPSIALRALAPAFGASVVRVVGTY